MRGTSREREPRPTSPAAQRQPGPSASLAMAGRNTSCPVELAAEKTPTTRPRCRTNQRLATIAPKTSASEPVPTPTAKPHSSQSCHGDGHHQSQAGTGGDHGESQRRRPVVRRAAPSVRPRTGP